MRTACAVILGVLVASTASAQPVGSSQPVSEAQPAPTDCVPKCRDGFVCSAGTCVSACNPPCPAGQECAADGRCVGTVPAPAPAPGGGGGWGPAPAPAPGGEWQAASEPTPAPGGTGAPPPPSGMVILPRFALLVTGSGDWDWKESGSLCGDGYYGAYCDDESASFDDKSSFGLGFDLLWHLSPGLRLGGELFYVIDTEIEVENNDFGAGSDLSLNFVVEGLIPLGPTTYMALRGFAGLTLLMSGGDLDDVIDNETDDCDDSDYYYGGWDRCDVNTGPYPGYTLGGAAGFLFALQSVRLRADLALQMYGISATFVERDRDGDDLVDEWDLSGTRFWLLAGAEF